MSNKVKLVVSICLLTMTCLSVSASAEELNIPTFRNVVAGSTNKGKALATNLDMQRKIGWQNINGSWYYYKNDGTKSTGWLNDNGIWYYLDKNGTMLHDTVVDGCVLSSSGLWIQ